MDNSANTISNLRLAIRKTIFVMLLAAVSCGAAAEWVKVSVGDGLDYYVDPATIRRSGNMVKMWVLIDYERTPVVGDGAFLSIKSQNEYDCKDERERRIYSTAHFGHMGAGRMVHSDGTPGNWIPVSPGSTGEAVWKLACGKK